MNPTKPMPAACDKPCLQKMSPPSAADPRGPVVPLSSTIDRRSFVKGFVLYSVASSIGGRNLWSLFVAEVEAQNTGEIGIFRMNLDTFTVLQSDFGSVRLQVTGMPTSFRQIIVTRMPGNQFFAVTSLCTHMGSTVNPYSQALQALRCPQHGSLFSPDGSVIGGPASTPLTGYTATFDGNKTVAIEIPGLGYSATIVGTANPVTGGTQVQLSFPTMFGLRYEVRFRASLSTGDWTQVPFSLTPSGATQTVLNGNNTGATVFVEGSSEYGFYAVIRY